MELKPIHVHDVDECNIRGPRFYALVIAKQPTTLTLDPISSRTSHYRVTARQVVGQSPGLGSDAA
jgi:hypothetical protein